MITAGEVAELNSERRCTAVAASTGERCKRRAEPSAAVCRMHGANGVTRRKAKAWQALDEMMPLYNPDAPPVTDPVAGLQRLGGIANDSLDVAGQKVNELRNWASVDAKGTAQLRVEIQLWTQMITRSESIFTTLAKLGLDERKVQLQERDQELIIAALRMIAADSDLALTEGQRRAWDFVVPKALKQLVTGED